jgi:DNA-binding transcriptional LysR family regulator
MLDGIEALIMLEKYGTVSEAAVRLRLTQSAVSKRIQALQQAVGFRIVEADGRRIRLTPEAINFLERARPLVAELRGLTTPVQSGSIASFSLALADSIASSWGPAVVSRALQFVKGVSLDLHAHRSVLLVESVRLGRYHIGLCTDDPVTSKDLIRYPIVDEPLVVIHSGFGDKPQKDSALISIEPSSATWRAVEPLISRHHPQWLKRHMIPVESFGAAVQMVKAGFGDGLVPLGLAIEMGLDPRCYRRAPWVKRRVSLLTRKTVTQLASFRLLHEQLARAAREYFANSGGQPDRP